MKLIISIAILCSTLATTNTQESVTEGAVTVNTTSSDSTNDEYSHIYQVQLELKTTKVDEPFSELEKRLNDLVERAFVMATYRHRKQSPPSDFSSSKSDYTTQIVKKRVIGESTFIHFVTLANGTPVTGEVVADDLNDLTVSQISAIIHYPLDKIISHRDIENSSGVKWWLISGILGSGAVVFVIGWFLLFIYFNTCGANQRCEEGDYMTRAQRAQIKKGIIINPSPPWARGIYDHPLGEPWVDPGPDTANNGTDKAETKKPSYRRSFRTLSEARLEKRLKEEAASKANTDTMQKAVGKQFESKKVDEMLSSNESTLTSGSLTDTEFATTRESKTRNVEKKKRQTKIEPITTNTMNEETAEISEVSSFEELSKSDEKLKAKKDEKKLRIDTSSGIKLPNSKKKSKIQSDIKSDPDSDYGSTTNDEEGKPTTKKIGHVSTESAKHRPAAAGKQRTSLFDKEDILHSMKPLPRVWTPYTAGDRITSFWKNRRDVYPSPATPTSDDVFEVNVEA